MGVRIANVVFDVEGPEVAGPVADLYAALLGLRRSNRGDFYRSHGWPADEGDDRDPMVFDDAGDGPNIAFEQPQPATYRPPAWPDPSRPAQLHLDLDVDDVDATHAVVLAHGGTLLADGDEHRVYADAGGHPFCVRERVGATPGRIAQIVVDGDDVEALERFWRGLLEAEASPPLTFRRIDAPPPAWPDAAHPQQVHFDLAADDLERARARAMELGARRLQHRGGGFVLTDPFGHPFCLGDE